MDSQLNELELIAELDSGREPSDAGRRSAKASLLRAIEESRLKAAGRRPRLRTRYGLAAVAALIAVPGAIAIASSLGGDVSTNYSSFLTGTGDVSEPGRPVEPSDNAPGSMSSNSVDDVRVLASSGSHHLFASRHADGAVSFKLDSGVEFKSTGANPWLNQFSGNAIVPLFVGIPNSDGLEPVAGLTASDVASVELRYSSGQPDVMPASGTAFIFVADLGHYEGASGLDGSEPPQNLSAENLPTVDRRPLEVVARDADGNVLQTQSLSCVAGQAVLAARDDTSSFSDYYGSC